jgi:hypothetical protein
MEERMSKTWSRFLFVLSVLFGAVLAFLSYTHPDFGRVFVFVNLLLLFFVIFVGTPAFTNKPSGVARRFFVVWFGYFVSFLAVFFSLVAFSSLN